MSDEAKFQRMLNADAKIFARLGIMKRLMANRWENQWWYLNEWQKAEYFQMRAAIEELSAKYNARQHAYHNSLAGKAQKLSGQVAEWFSSLWADYIAPDTNGMGNMGAIPAVLVWPIVAVVGIVAVSSLVALYIDQTTSDYDETLERVQIVSEWDPELAREILHTGAQLQEKQTGVFASIGSGIGKGLKAGIIILSLSAAGFIGYKIYESQQ
ncbi:MAG: hypothetical protein ACPGJS_05705 [Flammeovirgaceae bacterium]